RAGLAAWPMVAHLFGPVVRGQGSESRAAHHPGGDGGRPAAVARTREPFRHFAGAAPGPPRPARPAGEPQRTARKRIAGGGIFRQLIAYGTARPHPAT